MRDAALDRTARTKKNFAFSFLSLFLKHSCYFTAAETG